MIHVLADDTGKGKTSFLVYQIYKAYWERGLDMIADTKCFIDKASADTGRKFTYPDKPPIFTPKELEVKFPIGYKKYYEPYFINGFYFGLPNEHHPVISVPPGSMIVLPELGSIFDSYKYITLGDFVKGACQKHRHYHLEIWGDLQRIMSLDPNVRELAQHFIEIKELKIEKNILGQITSVTWHTREWTSWREYKAYLGASDLKNYTEHTYTINDNIFDFYDSYSCFNEFLPPEGDFMYLPRTISSSDSRYEKYKQFYAHGEPKSFRSKNYESK